MDQIQLSRCLSDLESYSSEPSTNQFHARDYLNDTRTWHSDCISVMKCSDWMVDHAVSLDYPSTDVARLGTATC